MEVWFCTKHQTSNKSMWKFKGQLDATDWFLY